jgi:cellulose synthase/poly-beta-1,6-N-acetylglucosamine synthase-like glycosyltransferase
MVIYEALLSLSPSFFVGLGSVFLGLYVLVVTFFAMAWRTRPFPASCSPVLEPSFISVIVPYKNESGSLPSLMKALGQQYLSPDFFEVIAVNDHSDDGGNEWLQEQLLFDGALRLLNAREGGKKNALKEGILSAQGNLIVTLDADCVPHPDWLSTISNWFRQTGADMLIGPVKMRSDGSCLSAYESIDYYALQMSGAGSAKLGFPVFCSGANLAFKKLVWTEASQHLAGMNRASGDDVFLLHAFKRLRKKIVFLQQSEAMVETGTSGSVPAFFRQRMRWGGKSTSYRDFSSIALAVIVLMANFMLLLLLALWLFGGLSGWFLGLAFLSKALADYLLLFQGRRLYCVSYSFFKHLLYSLVYPLVLVVTALGGLVIGERWK